MQFDLLSELDRLNFYKTRDGLEGAIEAGKQMIKTYRAAALATRTKGHTRKHPYRAKWVEAAASARHILRNNLLA